MTESKLLGDTEIGDVFVHDDRHYRLLDIEDTGGTGYERLRIRVTRVVRPAWTSRPTHPAVIRWREEHQ